MHADGVGVGIQADQQQINGSPATETLFNRFTEGFEPCHALRNRQAVIGTMGCAALMAGVNGTEVIDNALQIAGRVVGRIGIPLTGAAMLGFDPALNGVLDIKEGPCMGTPAHTTQRNAQGIGDGVGQPAISARRDVEQMKAAVEQELIKGFALIAS